jgi:hypothetical protein
MQAQLGPGAQFAHATHDRVEMQRNLSALGNAAVGQRVLVRGVTGRRSGALASSLGVTFAIGKQEPLHLGYIGGPTLPSCSTWAIGPTLSWPRTIGGRGA